MPKFIFVSSFVFSSLFSLSAFSADLKSPELKTLLCDAVSDHIATARPGETFESNACQKDGTFDVKAERKATYAGGDVVLNVNGKPVFVLKKGAVRVTSMEVLVKHASQSCEVDLKKNFPQIKAEGKGLVVKEEMWEVSAIDCQTEAAAALKAADLGDKNVKLTTYSAIPKAVRENMADYDLVPLIGYDGYYGLVEESYAKVMDSNNKVIGYFQLSLFTYSEDPEQHYWLFVYNDQGKLVAVPEAPISTIGDDEDAKGSTRRWIETGSPDPK